MLFSARHSAAATPHLVAAAAISISRAVAPARRSISCELRIERLPPVDMSPHTRPRARFSCGAANSVRTLLQSHSSSSATSIARAVSTPCPISDLAIRIVTVSSGPITSQAVISGAVLVLARAGALNGISKPSAREPLVATTLRRKQRRLTAPSVMLGSTTLPYGFGASAPGTLQENQFREPTNYCVRASVPLLFCRSCGRVPVEGAVVRGWLIVRQLVAGLGQSRHTRTAASRPPLAFVPLFLR